MDIKKLEDLCNQMQDEIKSMHQMAADQRCSKWGHYDVEGKCTDCGRASESS